MALFKVERTDQVDYQEYDSLVIRADFVFRARQMVLTGYFDGPYPGFNAGNFCVEEITSDGPEEVVMASRID